MEMKTSQFLRGKAYCVVVEGIVTGKNIYYEEKEKETEKKKEKKKLHKDEGFTASETVVSQSLRRRHPYCVWATFKLFLERKFFICITKKKKSFLMTSIYSLTLTACSQCTHAQSAPRYCA